MHTKSPSESESPSAYDSTAQHGRLLRKIVSVNTADLGGGAERIATLLHKSYRRRGLGSWLVVGDKRTDDANVIPFHSSPFIDYRPYAKPIQELLLSGQRRIDRALGWLDWQHPYSHRLADITGSPPDVVHLHNLHGGYFDLRAAKALSQRFPTFVTLNDCWWLTGHCAFPLGCERWRTGCGQCTLLHVAPEAKRRDATRRNWSRKAAVFCDCRFFVASPTEWLLNLARQSILAPAIVEGRVIPHGVDLAVFQPASQTAARKRLNLPSDAFIAMFAANRAQSNPFKDYVTIRRAIELLASERPIWMLAVGEAGDDECCGNARIRHVPFVRSQTDMALHYQASDVYLHAAHHEAFGIVLAEALACGLPVVATAVDGIPEVLEDGKHGFLVPHADAAALAAAVRRLYDDAPLRKTLGASATRHARRNFDAEIMVDRYLRWYAEVLDRKTAT